MPATKYLSKITLLDGTQVEIKDAVARQAVQGGTVFCGVTETSLTDGSTATTVTIGGQTHTANNGDIVVNGNKEFIYASSDGKWHELGDTTGLGALAVKNSATGSYTPAGTVSFTGGSVTSTGTFTPAGSVSKPDVDVTPTTTTVAEFKTAGSVTAGTAATCTLPTFSATYDDSTENLALGWSAGSFTTNTPTSVTLPTSKNTSVVTGVAAALHESPSFTGTQGNVSVTGTAAGSASFTGTAATITVS